MNVALAAGLLMTAGVMPVGSIIPEPDDLRLQSIRKAAGEQNWPFVAERGMLGCVEMLGERVVYFIPGDEMERAYNIDINLLAMSVANLGITNVLAPYEDSAQLLYRLVPFVSMGQRLCDQEPGTFVTEPEL
ncbi:hypothetical protein [Shinella sedimenti]|jgi:hypothetical protein|uniref:Uncharacterized protein n=1 Tax=Shinella sedimenti TaxID=2919913 RepID=A0ABT0CPH7_9HYPH|nr:hypothetical protein [Shinella sedimenti]MCJ8150491.1 hypothetical protein [Shinella sedimenti]